MEGNSKSDELELIIWMQMISAFWDSGNEHMIFCDILIYSWVYVMRLRYLFKFLNVSLIQSVIKIKKKKKLFFFFFSLKVWPNNGLFSSSAVLTWFDMCISIGWTYDVLNKDINVSNQFLLVWSSIFISGFSWGIQIRMNFKTKPF